MAGGSGNRMGLDIPKQFVEVAGRPVLMHTIFRFYRFDSSIEIILVLPEDQFGRWNELCAKYGFNVNHKVTKGGTTRFFSSKLGLDEINEDGIVAIHDGVRPLVSNETIGRCFTTAEKRGNAIPCIPIVDSIRKIDGNNNCPVVRFANFTIQ